ncbi:hypothetical protein M7775_19085 [Sporomusa sphaeroides DSM 2875]|uniref:hypothetical protein n=1 Tax=Sporomusa sphaeroides TaxID=47679 RepID=UPI00202F96C5|nr:hypothetical protein [Sporomusa sphaeroides]MCM0760658.1 hypothetical protein [Sporomusa sphaeroides DSM 2875]
MTTLPLKSQFTGAVTNGERKAAEEQLLDFLAQYLPEDGSPIPLGNIVEILAEHVTYTPSGNITATDMQDALTELAGRIVENPSYRNKLINGGFDIWQRGTSQTSNGYGSADRWRCNHVGSTKTVTRQTFAFGQIEVPGNPIYFMRTIVNSVAGAGNRCNLYQLIENVLASSDRTFTLSFWAKADSTKNIAIEFGQTFGTSGSPDISGIDVTTIQLTTTWEKYIIPVTFPSVSGKTINSNNLYYVSFWFDAGSNYDSVTNSLGQQSGTFDIAQVQLEEGSVATPFEQRPYGLELMLCQRYFWKIQGGINVVGYATGPGNQAYQTLIFPVTMRAVPTTTNSWFNSANASSQNVVAITANYSQVMVTAAGVGLFYATYSPNNTFDAEL